MGIIFYMFIKGGHKRIVGQIVLGLGLLFIGMNTMSSAVEPLKDLPGSSRCLPPSPIPFWA